MNNLSLLETRDAILDVSGQYRYTLTRMWRPAGDRVLFVMLNPSTADATEDDPTLCRCRNFAQRWGYGSLEVVNLFAYRATNSRVLAKVDDPIGPENDRYIREAAERCNFCVVACGTGGRLHQRFAAVLPMLPDPHCLALTKEGMPVHPLYQPADSVPVLYSRKQQG